jgi:hypothetical protein
MPKIDLTPEPIKILKKKKLKVFENGDYDLNIVGIRSKNRKAGKFDDLITCSFKINGVWQFRAWRATTDPSLYWLKSKRANKKGTAILKAGQYIGAYCLDKHRGKYLALCQRKAKVTVIRDSTKDETLDIPGEDGKLKKGTIEDSGFFGINIHRSLSASELERLDLEIEEREIGPFSAGCQVFADPADLDELLWLCKKQISTHPNWKETFSYTLIEE